MTTVDLSHIQFWQPPLTSSSFKQCTISPYMHKNDRLSSKTSSRNQPALPDKADEVLRRDSQAKPAVAAAQHQSHDFAPQYEDNAVGAQGRDNANSDDKVDDDLPFIEELIDQISREGASTGRYQNSIACLKEPALNRRESRLSQVQLILDDSIGNSQDRPVILEDNESDTRILEAAAASASVHTDVEPFFELNGCFVDADLHTFPPLEHDGLASTPSQDQHGDRTMRGASDEPASRTLLISLDKNGRGGSDENSSEFERGIQLAFEKQEKSSLASTPNSFRPHRHSAKLSHSQVDQQYDQGRARHGRLEEPEHISLLCNRDPEEEPQEQHQQQEAAAEATEEEGEESDEDEREREQEEHGEKRLHQDDTEEHNGIHHSESNNNRYNMSSEDNEDPQPAKRRKMYPVSPDPAQTPYERGPTPYLRRLQSLTPPASTQPEIGDAQSQVNRRHLSTPVDDEHHFTPPTPRSPSTTMESAPVAEYQEWPFQGFLKCITIGNQMTYNLEFSVSHVPEHLNLSLHSKVLSTDFKESSAEATISHKHIAPRKSTRELTKEQENQLAKLVHKDKTWTEIGRHFPGHTLQTLKENFKKQGGKPRKRGRKPGVRNGVA